MAVRKKTERIAEYGDFQTPRSLARGVCSLLSRLKVVPAAIVEPTCGIGNFLVAALDQFSTAGKAIGLDINPEYVQMVRSTLQRSGHLNKTQIIQGSFFDAGWPALLRSLPDPLLVIGNPPWVTNTELGTLRSSNLPRKTNFKNLVGLEAVTGKSNFDISEWMLLQILQWLDGRDATMAMLCKTAVARKVLNHAWKHEIGLASSRMHLIDANASFGASVDACLLVCTLSASSRTDEAAVYGSLGHEDPAQVIGYRDGHLIADIGSYERRKHLRGNETYRWRSGVKHDCAKVMELTKEGGRFRNGLQELVDLEDQFVYPMLKSSEIAKASPDAPKRWMLVTQRQLGEDTRCIREHAPRTWEYLQSHAERLGRRASSIYRNRPAFSIFGVGDYSFAPWKVAISGLYKRLKFAPVGSFGGKPIVLDDTCYFVPCETRAEAHFLAGLLNSDVARDFLSAFVFWDTKRPVTIDKLRQLDLVALARELGSEEVISEYLSEKALVAAGGRESDATQLGLFDTR